MLGVVDIITDSSNVDFINVFKATYKNIDWNFIDEVDYNDNHDVLFVCNSMDVRNINFKKIWKTYKAIILYVANDFEYLRKDIDDNNLFIIEKNILNENNNIRDVELILEYIFNI